MERLITALLTRSVSTGKWCRNMLDILARIQRPRQK